MDKKSLLKMIRYLEKGMIDAYNNQDWIEIWSLIERIRMEIGRDES